MNTMTRSLEEIYTYEKQALDLIPIDHPNYAEIRSLLIDQVNDEVEEYANSRPNTGASTT